MTRPALPQILAIGELRPRIAADAFIAPGAVIIGDVHIGSGASIWFNCVLRGDVAPIHVGRGTSIQDGSVVHADPGYPVRIGDDALIGHVTVIHGCTIGAGALVGMGGIILSGAVIEAEAMLGAGAMLTGGKVAAARQLWAGRPARHMRELTDTELADMRFGVAHYRKNAARYRKDLSGCE